MLKELNPIRLRATRAADLDFVQTAESAPENRMFVGQWTVDEHRLALLNSDISHQIVEPVSGSQSLGYVILTGLNNSARSINLRRLVIVAKGQGYGRATLRMLKRQVFWERQAHRFWLDVKVDNQRARQLYRQEGWVLEGVLREAHLIGDEMASVAILAMLAMEYRARVAEGLEFDSLPKVLD
ncbi:MAG: GNAT family N-acetyltransferase [Spirulinaceae cyanobacterium RM2_2_10]|nr:GNAT family N-acetyltransferase [Spirulinaceae cyanobacterium RM2_2_10]